jgi:hypothetical protein
VNESEEKKMATDSGGWSKVCDLFTGDSRKQTAQQFWDEAQMMTVQFGITTPELVANNNPIRCEADIFWTVEKNTIQRKISVGNGSQISGLGQGVSIDVRDVTTDIGAGFPLGVKYQVTITIAKGTRPASLQYPILVPNPSLVVVPAANATPFNVPQGIGVTAVAVVAQDPTGVLIPAGAVSVIHQTPGGAFIFKEYDPRDYQWQPIVPGAQILLRNFTANPVDFGVTFGIEG